MPMEGEVIGLQCCKTFYSKIIHHFGAKHANIDALNKNLVSMSKEDEDFGNKIQDLK
jgi:hypothetical protein